MQPTTGTPYQNSGHISYKDLLLASIVVILACALLGYVYAWSLRAVRIDLVQGIFFFLYAAGTAVICFMGWYLAKARSILFVALISVLSCCISFYWAWVFWVMQYHPNGVLVFHPVSLWNEILVTYKAGVKTYVPVSRVLKTGWRVSYNPYGPLFSEAIALFGIGMFGSFLTFRDTFFCEGCNEWMEAAHTITDLQPVEHDAMISDALKHGDLQPMLALDKTDATDHTTTLLLYMCKSCKIKGVLTWADIQRTEDKKGKPEVKQKVLLSATWLTDESLTVLSQKMQEWSKE